MCVPGLLLAKLDTILTREFGCICLEENVEETNDPPERGSIGENRKPGKQVYLQLSSRIEDELHGAVCDPDDLLGGVKGLHPQPPEAPTSSLCSLHGQSFIS